MFNFNKKNKAKTNKNSSLLDMFKDEAEDNRQSKATDNRNSIDLEIIRKIRDKIKL